MRSPSGFSPTAFLVGIFVGTVGLAVLGATVRPSHLISGFQRFHIGFNTRHLDVTGRELAAMADTIGPDRIAVVVGGTSVMQGATQAGSMVWTKALQRNLGERFFVLNLAQRAGASNDTGNAVAEMLLKRNSPVIYLCDAMPNSIARGGEESRFQFIMFDTWRRGYLLDWPPRDKVMSEALWSRAPGLNTPAWGTLLDRWLNFRDLWNYVSYEVVGTVWNPIDTTMSFQRLRDVEDPEPTPDWIKANLPNVKAITGPDMDILRRLSAAVDPEYWKRIDVSIDESFPRRLREVSLVLVDLNNPSFLARLTEDERLQFGVNADLMRDRLLTSGFRRALVPERGFDDQDFNDRVHLSVAGGEKLAQIVAPEIKSLATELGYTH